MVGGTERLGWEERGVEDMGKWGHRGHGWRHGNMGLWWDGDVGDRDMGDRGWGQGMQSDGDEGGRGEGGGRMGTWRTGDKEGMRTLGGTMGTWGPGQWGYGDMGDKVTTWPWGHETRGDGEMGTGGYRRVGGAGVMGGRGHGGRGGDVRMCPLTWHCPALLLVGAEGPPAGTPLVGGGGARPGSLGCQRPPDTEDDGLQPSDEDIMVRGHIGDNGGVRGEGGGTCGGLGGHQWGHS